MKGTEMICILCPQGCLLTVTRAKGGVGVLGNLCPRGRSYGEQELLNPMRVVTASVRTLGGALPLCPVKTRSAVPKERIEDVLREIRQIRIQAPVKLGQVLIPDVAQTGVAVVATAGRE